MYCHEPLEDTKSAPAKETERSTDVPHAGNQKYVRVPQSIHRDVELPHKVLP